MKIGGRDDHIYKTRPVEYLRLSKKYMKELDISVVLCEDLATSYDGVYIHKSNFMISNWAIDSEGFAWRTYIYGLFKTKNDRKYIIPLKFWCGYYKRDTFPLYDQWYYAQKGLFKGYH